MADDDFFYLKDWFTGYRNRFESKDSQVSAMIDMKVEHSFHVADDCRAIAGELGLSGREVHESAVMGLFHDIGRFQQLAVYGTFSDSKSVNHAELGASILEEENILGTLGADVANRLIQAIRLHNVLCLPEGLDKDTLMFARIVRDADKLDICDILFSAWKNKELEKYPEIMFGIALEGPVTREAVDQIRRKETISFRHLRNLPDFFLTQLSWVYDINCAPAFALIAKRGIVANITEALSGQDGIADILNDADEYVKSRC